ncbi:cytochrome P450 [Blastococcus sp. URHD0036]|uniref:cytochrome P450 n=1 Tax=Blastococcus sp. URHD0036 TaxID=1380356 RepID=UPI00049694A4|nr:cytochrome P450 [Blastococcus sp. URHD0036]
MSTDETTAVRADDAARTEGRRIVLDRHGPEYRTEFVDWAKRLHAGPRIAWNDTHGGYWFVNGNQELFDVARRSDVLSNDADIRNERRGYDGINIPASSKETRGGVIGGFLEMDPPVQRYYRNALNAYLSPAAVARWQPVLDEITRAAIDEKIESGRIDFVEDLANIVPAVLTMALLGLPLEDWVIYNEPSHASVYTPIHSPDHPRVMELAMQMGMSLFGRIQEAKTDPKPGLLSAVLNADLGDHQQDDMEAVGVIMLLIGGGFDTTTALTAHSLEWLGEHPDQRERLVREWDTLRDSATEEFLRFYTPAQGDGRTVSADVEIDGVQFKEGDRLWLSWAMANRDEQVFPDPHEIKLDRTGNRHASFGLGIHRCIGSNVARAGFKTMVKAVLDRMPDFVCDPAGTVHYETTQVINGMRYLPATFTPGKRLGPGLEETIAKIQRVVDEQRLAEPVTVRKERATLG